MVGIATGAPAIRPPTEIIAAAKDSWSQMLPLPQGMRAAGQEQAQVLVRAPVLP